MSAITIRPKLMLKHIGYSNVYNINNILVTLLKSIDIIVMHNPLLQLLLFTIIALYLMFSRKFTKGDIVFGYLPASTVGRDC